VEAARPVAIVPVGTGCQTAALKLAQQLRLAGYPVEMSYRGNMAKRLKRANKARCRAVILIGDDELARATVTVKNFDDGSQTEVALDKIMDYLK